MDVSTIAIPKEIALEKLDEYSHIQSDKRLKEDTELRRIYKWAAEHPLIDVAQALRETGLRENGHPKLALAKANWPIVFYSEYSRAYSSSSRYFTKTYAIKLPSGTYRHTNSHWINLSSPVPHIPPHLRPDDDLSKYHILFEVEKWNEYPRDPFLLKQISGWIFAIIAEWDLTELEQKLLSGMLSRN